MAWALAISLIFISMLLLLTILYLHLGKNNKEERNQDGSIIRFSQKEKHVILRIGILGLMASYGLATIGLMPKLLAASNINDSGILSVVNSAVVVIGMVIYIFLAYLIVYIMYSLIMKAVENTQSKKRKRVEL